MDSSSTLRSDIKKCLTKKIEVVNQVYKVGEVVPRTIAKPNYTVASKIESMFEKI